MVSGLCFSSTLFHQCPVVASTADRKCIEPLHAKQFTVDLLMQSLTPQTTNNNNKYTSKQQLVTGYWIGLYTLYIYVSSEM